MDYSLIFGRPTLEAASAMLGMELLLESCYGPIGGRIVETEAYLGSLDAASHSFHGSTNRNAAMFGPPGTIYVYFTYGRHYCLNIVASPPGIGEAILIRALEPTRGVEIMERRRHVSDQQQLLNGPAKITQSLGIGPIHNQTNLLTGPLRIEMGEPVVPADIIATPRVGIRQATDLLWRFHIRDNPYVSRVPKPHA